MSINPLPVSPNQVDSDAMRTKINELISDNSSVTVADTPPASPGEGDLWFDVDTAATYVYVGNPTNAWVQANSGGSGGSSVTVENVPPTSPEEGDLWFDVDTAATHVYVGNPTNAWIQANSGAGSSGIVQSNATTSADGLMSSEDKTKLDGMSSGGAINRYAVTAGYLSGIGNSKQVSSLGTGITVPSGISSVFILGAEMSGTQSFSSGASIPHNTGVRSWNTSAYVNLYSAGEVQARAYWGMHPGGGGPVDNKIYVVCTAGYTVTSLFLMFI